MVGAYNARENIKILAGKTKGKRQLAKSRRRLLRRIFKESSVGIKVGLVWINMRSRGWIFVMEIFHERRRISWSVE